MYVFLNVSCNIQVIITAIITAVITTVITLSINNLWHYIFSPEKKLEYEIISNKTLTKTNIITAITGNFPNSIIDFSKDDSIIPRYQYTIIELRNLGISIDENLFFKVDFNDERVKILDVLCKQTEPLEKK